MIATSIALLLAATHAPSVETARLNVGGRALRVQVVRVRLADVQVKVGLAKGRVGSVEELSAIAKRAGALVAINGCYFDAYSHRAVRNPDHNIIVGGKLCHIGLGTTFGVDGQGRARIERVVFGIEGKVAGKRRFYAYRVNHDPLGASSASMFDSRYASGTAPAGRQVVVRNGQVVAKSEDARAIPKDGVVFHFKGGDAGLFERFNVGDSVDYRTVVKEGDKGFWSEAVEALGCGPTLLKGGRIALDPAAEGFSGSAKLTKAYLRSAVGLGPNGEMLLVEAVATLGELAQAMLALGATDAMNLDGGASAGLWVRGRYLRKPGRRIANALVVLSRARA